MYYVTRVLIGKWPPDQLESAAIHCLSVGRFGSGYIRSILKRGVHRDQKGISEEVLSGKQGEDRQRRRAKQLKLESRQSQLFDEEILTPEKPDQEAKHANVFELFPAKSVETSYAMVGGLPMGPAEFGADPCRITHRNTIHVDRQISTEICGTVEDTNPEVEPDNAETVETRSGKVEEARSEVDQSSVSQARRPFSHLMVSLGIVILLGANTFFLCHEQYSLYESLGYSSSMSVFLAVLTEVLLVALSLLSTWTSSRLWKFLLLTGCLSTVAVVVNLLDASVQNRTAENIVKSERVIQLNERMEALAILEKAALSSIAGLDPEKFPTKIARLSNALTGNGPEGYSRQLEILRQELADISLASNSSNAGVLRWQRRVSMLCNLILSGFLGFLWMKAGSRIGPDWQYLGFGYNFFPYGKNRQARGPLGSSA